MAFKRLVGRVLFLFGAVLMVGALGFRQQTERYLCPDCERERAVATMAVYTWELSRSERVDGAQGADDAHAHEWRLASVTKREGLLAGFRP